MRFDPWREESRETQEHIRQAAEAKRARKANKRIRDAQLTALGREVSRLKARHRGAAGYHRVLGFRWKGRSIVLAFYSHPDVEVAELALNARRAFT